MAQFSWQCKYQHREEPISHRGNDLSPGLQVKRIGIILQEVPSEQKQ